MIKISEIKNELENTRIEDIDQVLVKHKDDERAGVIKLLQKYEKEKEKLANEKQRIEQMKEFEYKYKDYEFICGVDEVGRGPLAGPVIAGAVILPKDCNILYLNDSKQLSEKKREELLLIVELYQRI